MAETSAKALLDKLRQFMAGSPAVQLSATQVSLLVAEMNRYYAIVKREVDGAKNKRNLVIHNTTRLIYEQQMELIDELQDQLEEDEEFSHNTLSQLIIALEEGEEIC